MPSILFFAEKISFKLSDPSKTSSWLKRICRSEKRKLGQLNYIFCSDIFLRNLNKEYLNHDTYTDILSFDESEDGRISGEIYISIPRVKENAKKYNQPFQTELRRVIAHGLLHLVGYSDKVRQQKAAMRSKEEACLSLWK